MHESAADQHPATLSGRHFFHRFICQVRRVQKLQDLVRFRAHLVSDVVVRPDADAGEEAGEDDFEAGDLSGALGHQIVGNNAEHRAEVDHIPEGFAEDGHRGAWMGKRVALACDGFDQRRFSAPVGAQNRYVLPGAYGQGEIFENQVRSPHNGDVA